jgi:fumarate hydratase class II
MTDYRIEKDSLGEVKVPKDVYWGAQTQRAIENFPISGETFEPGFIRALGIIKKSAAKANGELGFLEEKTVNSIVLAADEVISGELIDQFQVDVFQTGSGTSSNMNANEVIANRACEIAGEGIGSKVIHPNDHVNFGQSSNDIIPTAMHVAALESIDKEVIPALETLKLALEKKEKAFSEVVKTGRTHLQDATPITLGQEFGGYKTQIEKGIKRIENVRGSLAELPIGGTAVGTGLNMHPDFPKMAIEYISEETGIQFKEAIDHFEAQSAHDAMSEAHAALRVVAYSACYITKPAYWI